MLIPVNSYLAYLLSRIRYEFFTMLSMILETG